jgi:magnesium-protoporphyrin IX monomethyl ester (oxidative) cyclase
MSKKVALINPGGQQELYSATEPLNLGFLAAYLEKNGVEVRIIDELAGEDAAAALDEFKPDIAGITAVTPLAVRAYEIADMCRARGMLTVMGGVHASVLPDEALRHCDIVVKGEGEAALLEIARGTAERGVISRPYLKDLDELPPPARHLMKMDFYLRGRDRLPGHTYNFADKGAVTAAMMCSRGCPYSCIFCHNSWRGMPCRFNSAERVVDELQSLVRDYGVNTVFFLDDDLFLSKPRIKRICELILERKLNVLWSAAARAERVDVETLTLARQAGCRKINFGFESGSQRILDVLNKRGTVAQNMAAIEICRKAGVEACGTFMIGNPGETMADIEMTVDFIKRSGLKYRSVLITTPFPGTQLWNWCVSKGFVPENLNWNDFNYSRAPVRACENFTQEEIERLHERITEELYGNEPIPLGGFLLRKLLHPWDGLRKALRRPSDIWRVLKRLRLGGQ